MRTKFVLLSSERPTHRALMPRSVFSLLGEDDLVAWVYPELTFIGDEAAILEGLESLGETLYVRLDALESVPTPDFLTRLRREVLG